MRSKQNILKSTGHHNSSRKRKALALCAYMKRNPEILKQYLNHATEGPWQPRTANIQNQLVGRDNKNYGWN